MIFVEDLDIEANGSLKFGSGIGTGYKIVGFFGYAASGFRSERFDGVGCFGAREAVEFASDDEGETFDWMIGGRVQANRLRC